jgi:hypothetical protein
MPMGVEPTSTGLQPVAWPSGSSIICKACPRQESNLALDLRRVACESTTLRGHLYNCHPPSAPPRDRTSSCSFEDCRANPAHSQGVLQSVSSPSRDRTWSCSFGGCRATPAHSRTIRNQSRRLDSHQHLPVYKTGAFLCRATSANINQHEREESNPVWRFWRPLPLPGGHSCKGPGPVKARSQSH